MAEDSWCTEINIPSQRVHLLPRQHLLQTEKCPCNIVSFAPSNGVSNSLFALVIGKNVKKIDTFIDMGEDGCEPNPDVTINVAVHGYKGTAAEEWYADFIEIKD